MKKCINCGKWAFLSPLDNNSRCRSCAEAYEKKLMKDRLQSKAKEDHKLLAHAYQAAPNLTQILYSSTYDSLIKDFDSCNYFLQVLSEIDINNYFSSVFLSVLTPSEFSFIHKEHPVFGFCISDPKKGVCISEKIREIKNSVSESHTYLASAIPKTAEFIDTMRTLCEIPVSLDTGSPPISPSNMPEYACSAVSAYTKYDSIKDYVVIDVETTGLNPEVDEIIQIAAVRFSDFVPVTSWSTFVKPTRSIPAEVTAINGITDDMVITAPKIHEVLGSLIEFVGKTTPLVGHNLPFDLHFLHNAGAAKMLQGRRRYDTLTLSQRTYKSAKYTLEFLTRLKLHIVRPVAHDAKADCLATGLLFEDICKTCIK